MKNQSKMLFCGNTTMKRIGSLALVATGLFSTAVASADDKQVAKDYVVKPEDIKKEEKKNGVDWAIKGGATLNLSDNRSVVGQVDGSTVAFGFQFGANLNVRQDAHEWRNSMTVAAGVTRTPSIDAFVKSQDQIDAESIYLYHFNDWLGAFARVAWSSQMFRGTDVRGGPTSYQITLLDGTVVTPAPCAIGSDGAPIPCSQLTLTDPLRPSRFRESVGLFAQPVTTEPFNLETRLGLGGRETLAKGQLSIQDNPGGVETPQVEVVELDDVLQLGAEGVVEIRGSFEDKKVGYKAGAEVMIPFVTNDNTNRSAASLTNVLLYANVDFKLVEWASLNYSFRALREPQLLDAWQIQNQLLLTMGLAAGSASPAAPAKK